MPSSTSVSDRARAARALVVLIAALLAWLLLLEVAMRTVLPRISETQRRLDTDERVALTLRPRSAEGARSVLLIGNSLLEQGIDREQLQRSLRPDYAIAYYPVESTTYLDWLYGLRHLFAQGAAPATVVLCMSGRQLLSNATYGETFAYRLLEARDLPQLMREGHLDLMTASAYLFALKSAWLGERSAFRLGLLQKWLPHSDLLAAHVTDVDPLPLIVDRYTLTRAIERLQALQSLARAHGATFVYLVPPSLNPADIGSALTPKARAAGIAVVMPYQPGEMPRAGFADGLHLNPGGASDFTTRVAPALRQALNAGEATAAAASVPAAASP